MLANPIGKVVRAGRPFSERKYHPHLLNLGCMEVGAVNAEKSSCDNQSGSLIAV